MVDFTLKRVDFVEDTLCSLSFSVAKTKSL